MGAGLRFRHAGAGWAPAMVQSCGHGMGAGRGSGRWRWMGTGRGACDAMRAWGVGAVSGRFDASLTALIESIPTLH